MPITYTCQHGELTARLSGEIDHHGARTTMDALDEAIQSKLPLRLTLDLSGVTFMDSSGIAVLIRAKRQMDGLGGTVKAVSIPDQPRRVLDAAGLGRLITLE
jgi:stage II sporulation protein AA (anti-sigma F factor antagonist)